MIFGSIQLGMLQPLGAPHLALLAAPLNRRGAGDTGDTGDAGDTGDTGDAGDAGEV